MKRTENHTQLTILKGWLHGWANQNRATTLGGGGYMKVFDNHIGKSFGIEAV
jgi:hypothetical protein